MKIKIGDNVLIDVSDGRNYTLYLKQEVIDIKTKKLDRVDFVFEGYYPNVESALSASLKREAFLNNKGLEITVNDYIKELKLISKKHLEEIKAVAIEKKLNKKRSDKNGKFVDL